MSKRRGKKRKKNKREGFIDKLLVISFFYILGFVISLIATGILDISVNATEKKLLEISGKYTIETAKIDKVVTMGKQHLKMDYAKFTIKDSDIKGKVDIQGSKYKNCKKGDEIKVYCYNGKYGHDEWNLAVKLTWWSKPLFFLSMIVSFIAVIPLIFGFFLTMMYILLFLEKIYLKIKGLF